MSQQHLHFVTGRLAEYSLVALLPDLAAQVGFSYTVQVLPITVAALMTPEWIAKHLSVPTAATQIVLPGYCEGPLQQLTSCTSVPIVLGPRDLRQLPQFFSQDQNHGDYGDFDIEILAEINHCPRLSLEEILRTAKLLAEDGADVIDVGCEPGHVWAGLGEVVGALRADGRRVSVDSLDPTEIQAAVSAGAELVLSVNSSNREAALDWGVPVVAIPDEPESLAELDDTIELLAHGGVPVRIDPILEPISFGFSTSLGRYLEIRRRYPDAEMMMGIGNLSELTDVDSAGVNTLLLGFCQEQGIRSVLTTQVINWAQSSVRECDRARRLMYHAVTQRILPKHLEPQLLMLRDESHTEAAPEEIAHLAAQIKDNNYRVFAAAGEVHLVARELHLHDEDPFTLMQQLLRSSPEGGLPTNLDPSHAFYLGYEMCKAKTALTLGKQYSQDESLDWGLATVPENRHYLRKTPGNKS